jgi:predicted DNA-binding transcriptional regulator AlpA
MDLIDTGDIAADLGLERDYVTRKVVKRPDFPFPLLVLSRKTVKWSREAYEAWKANHYLRASAQSR